MKLKYVGDMPVITKNGVNFDHSRPDKYTYLSGAVELLEALSYGATETTTHLYNTSSGHLDGEDIKRILYKYVKNVDALIDEQEQKAESYENELMQRVRENEYITQDEKTAWLENIKLMKDYFYQYIANQTAYEAALKVLSDEIHEGRIKEVCVPMFKNYAMVLNDLVETLERRKAPIDSTVKIEQTDDGLTGTLCITHY